MTDIEKLQEIIDEIDVLIEQQVKYGDPELKQWKHKAERFLFNHYGLESYEFRIFHGISYYPDNDMDYRTDSDYIEACKKGLNIAKGMLTDILSDFQGAPAIDKTEELFRIFKHFRKFAVELAHRHDGRETLRIQDEYDVQDLLRALLSLYFDDVRPEEWTPSYAGSSLRIDFLIPEIEAVIEVKKTRPTMTDKTLSEELIVDIEKYQAHSNCKKIYCFVYDPDMILRNPAAIRNDLEQKHEGLVRVFIES